jgi:molybdopterin-binding protein
MLWYIARLGGRSKPLGAPVVVASITNEAVDELKLKKGEKAYAVIKATDVMVGLD